MREWSIVARRLIDRGVARQVDGKLPYNTFVVMILVEVFKAAISAAFQIQSGNSLMKTPSLWYALPGFCYMITDNLTFVLMTLLDPATVNLLWNGKVVFTALLMYFVLGSVFTRTKWIALVMLTASLILSEVPKLSELQSAARHPNEASPFVWGLVLTLVGTMIVSGGNVSCEWIMKKDKEETLFWQNFQLYSFGIVFNLVGYASQWAAGNSGAEKGFFEGFTIWTWLIIVVQSFSGMCVGAVIKYLDNVAVIYCHSVAVFLITILGRLIFGFEVTSWFVAGIVLCTVSLKLYYARADFTLSVEEKQSYAPVPGLVSLEDDELAGLGFDDGELDIDIDDLDDVIAGLNDEYEL